MAKGNTIHSFRKPKRRPGVHSKNKNLKKRYRGQGRV